MKKSIPFLMLVLLLGAGCASAPVAERNTATPAEALIGHWRMSDGSGEVYFTPGGDYRFIDRDGNTGSASYRVIDQDSAQRRIVTVIRLRELGGEAVEESAEMMVEGTFSPDYTVHSGESIREGGVSTGSFTMEYLGEE